MTVILALAVAALAQEEEGGPLAIPAAEPAPDEITDPPRAEVVVPDRPLAIPGDRRSDPALAHAVREYRSRHLAVRHLSEAYVGTSWSYGWYGGYGWHHPGWGGWVAFPHPFFVRRDDVAVFRGPDRLDVPETLGALGDSPARKDLERRIRSNRRAANVLYGLGVVGIVGSVTGLVGMDRSSTFEEIYTWNVVAWSGVGLMVGGFIGGSFPGARAHTLQFEPEATFDLADLQDRVQEHNEALAAELGLDPMEAVRLEGPPTR